MKLAHRIIEASDFELVLDQMSNNEFDSDQELLDFLSKETRLDKKKLKSLIKKERSTFLKQPIVKGGAGIIKAHFE